MFQCFASGVKGFAIFSSNLEAHGEAAVKTFVMKFNSTAGKFSPVAPPHGAAVTDVAQRGRHAEFRIQQSRGWLKPSW